jgi:hypothetical protein
MAKTPQKNWVQMPDNQAIQEFGAEYSERQTVQQEWDLIERFVMPFRGKFFYDQRSEHSIEWRHREIYDSTAVMAAQNLASSLHSALTNPADQWFFLKFRQEYVTELPGALEWIEEATRITYESLQDSNFNLEVNEVYQDVVGFGSSVITEEIEDEKEWRGINFTAIPIKEAYFRQDHKGQVYRFWRLWQMTPSQMISKFGRENVPPKVLTLEENDTQDRIDVVFVIWQRYPDKVAPGKVLSAQNRPYGYKYLLKEGPWEQADGTWSRMLGEEGGYYEMPAFVPRWRKTSMSKWGNSPATIALADIMTLNQLVELVLRSAEKVVDPPILAEERAILAELTLKAGGINVVRKASGIVPFESRARFDVSQMRMEDLRQAIRSYFYIDQLELKESPAMTATEVNVRYEMMQRMLGPTMGRLQTDFLDPMVKRTFNILMRAGRLPEIPESLLESNSTLDIEYRGPLARSQYMDEVGAIERWVSFLGNTAQMASPEILDTPRWDMVGSMTGALMGVPAKMIRTKPEIEAVQKQRQQQQEAQQQAEMANQMAQAGAALDQGDPNAQ